MAIRSFSVGPVKGLKKASWTGLPNLVVISGPNGSGKSTLLSQLWNERDAHAEAGTEVIFMGPNRPWRKSTLSGAASYSLNQTYREMLGMHQFPGWQGYPPSGLESMGGGPREADSFDEVQNLAKLSIMKLGQRWLELLGSVYVSNNGSIPQDVIPDVFEPLRSVTRHLLPHLNFSRVDTSDPSNIKCMFKRSDGEGTSDVDIDNLSSGEKAVITLFLPFLESRIQALINSVIISSSEPEDRPLSVLPTALIDEPEIHLHPTLQVLLVDYLRELTRAGEAQFIITTHSPTILDSLQDNELFLLAPVSSVGDGNQFVQVASTEEKLESIRTLTGSTHLLTRCRPIVYIEGESPENYRLTSDQRLIELLIPEADTWVTVPGAGRKEVIRSAGSLRESATDGLPGVPVFALVDSDRGDDDDPDFVISWPVSMIENLLLDPEIIWSFLEPYREGLEFRMASEVERSLRSVASSFREDEIRLRAKGSRKFISSTFKVCSNHDVAASLATLEKDIQKQIDAIREQSARIEEDFHDATTAVDSLIESGLELQKFRGKQILKKFWDKHVKQIFPGYRNFVYGIAVASQGSLRLARLTVPSIQQIQYFIPRDLTPAIEQAMALLKDTAMDADARGALERTRSARECWQRIRDDPSSNEAAEKLAAVNMDRLRSDSVMLARLLRQFGHTEVERRVLSAMAQLGSGIGSAN